MTTIYLIGFMGCGKSTIGKALNRLTKRTYIDTDEYIQDKHQREIKEIFATEGEDVFRTYESEALKELTTYDIISTGGGIVERKENINVMRKNGMIVYLKTSFHDIIERLQHDDTRPLWNPEQVDDMRKLFNRRIDMYEYAADIIINTSDKTVAEIAKKIVAIKQNKNEVN